MAEEASELEIFGVLKRVAHAREQAQRETFERLAHEFTEEAERLWPADQDGRMLNRCRSNLRDRDDSCPDQVSDPTRRADVRSGRGQRV